MDNFKIAKKSQKAGGIPAIYHTMKKSWEEMGWFRPFRVLSKANQVEGFDCPGCAWPDPDRHRSLTEFCENGAKAIADEATTLKVDAHFFTHHSLADLRQKSRIWLNEQGRIVEPMYLPKGGSHYRPISWEDAFELIASQIKKNSDPDKNIFYTSGRTSNEAAFLYQLLCRSLGTNNLPDCSNLCHESSGKGLGETIGIGKGTVTLEDIENTDLLIIVGQNPGSNHPRMLTSLQKAKRNGSKIISVNPIREVGTERFIHPQEVFQLFGQGTELSDLHLPLRINSDVALFQWLSMNLVAAHDINPTVDEEFIADHTSGFSEFRKHLSALDSNLLKEATGLSSNLLEQALHLVCESKSIIVCWAMGLTQHKNAVDNIKEVVNFLLLRGNIGRPGAGVCPVRGHSNVQGDRTMGIWEEPSESFLAKMETGLGLKTGSLPRKHGFSAVDAVASIEKGSCGFFMAMGGNFVDAMSDTDAIKSAMKKIPLTVQISTKLNSSHLWTGEEALILPVLGRTEKDETDGKMQFVTVENSMGIVHASRGGLKPASTKLLSEVKVICEMGKRILPHIDWESFAGDYDEIRTLISKCISGFEDFNKKVRVKGGFYLENKVKDNREFATRSGKAQFTCNKMPEWKLGDGEFLMMTIRSHDQFNTTVYSANDRYRGVFSGRNVVFLNSLDMSQLGLAQGDFVDISTNYKGVKRQLKKFHAISYEIPTKNCATYFPETNVLVPLEEFADISKTPVSKSVVVRIEKSLA